MKPLFNIRMNYMFISLIVLMILISSAISAVATDLFPEDNPAFASTFLGDGGEEDATRSAIARDPDGSGLINILDVTYLVNYLYKSGPEPIC